MPIPQTLLTDITQKLIYAAQTPIKIILFGSYARGDATDNSDLDFLVIESEIKDKYAEMGHLRHAIGSVGVDVDILVYTQKEVEQRGHIPSSALYWALQEGLTLYEKGDSARTH